MKIAIPLYKDRVSPFLEWCTHILLIETENDNILHRTRSEIAETDPWELSRQMMAMGVEKIVCDGILYYIRDWFIMMGVEVMENQKGSVEEVIAHEERREIG